MEIENVTALLKQHVYEQNLGDAQELTVPSAGEDLPLPPVHSLAAWETSPSLPWTAREPFSPPTMGYPLPYLDVMTFQSKRLLPVAQKELDAQRRQMRTGGNGAVELHHDRLALDEDPSTTNERERDDRALEDAETDNDVKPEDPDRSDVPALDFDAILRSVRLLMEPIAIPDLSHTGVKWQLAHTGHATTADTPVPLQLCVTVPNHSFDETQVKLFYPTGAKNTNMREYIKDTIQKHMAGLTSTVLSSQDRDHPSPTKAPHERATLPGSESMPALHALDVDGGSSPGKTLGTSPTKKKCKHKTGKRSPTKLPSPHKKSGVASGARLSGSVSTSGLLNPELTRQAKDILAQLRANTNKINDLIG